MTDRTNHHLFQPLLYQVATGILSEGEIVDVDIGARLLVVDALEVALPSRTTA